LEARNRVEGRVEGEPEQFLMRMVGGPRMGTRVAESGYEWPLPEVLEDDGGIYVKVSQSKLPAETLSGGKYRVLRGAEYQWVPDPEEWDRASWRRLIVQVLEMREPK